MEATPNLQRQETVSSVHWYAYANDTVERYMTQTPPASLSDTDSKISELATIIEDGND